MARSTAATVPASKVEIGKIYAIKHEDRLVRFTATAVVTRRESAHGNPHDYKSKVEGIVPAPDNDGKPVTITVEPAALLGFYTEHVELMARERNEKSLRDAREAAHKANTEALYAALYEATGLTPPESDRDYSAPYRLGYRSNSIEIVDSGVAPLLQFFERVKATT